jgi:hypothetical protein
MKLRIKGDSLRLRLGPAEVQQFLTSCCIEETIHFAPGAHLTYALEHSETEACVFASHAPGRIVVTVPTKVAQEWARSNDVGIHCAVPNGSGFLDLAVEKDFACLDRDHAGNQDTYPNPKGAC